LHYDPTAPSKTCHDKANNHVTEIDTNLDEYDGACGVFINEGAYYYAESGVGVGIVRQGFVDVPKA